MTFTENPGTRPSKLALGRLASGELDAAESDRVQRAMDASGRAWLDGVAATRVAPFDAASLRARAASLPSSELSDAPALPAPANDRRGLMALIPLLVVAALALIVAVPALREVPGGGVDPDYVGVRAGVGLQAFHLQAGQLTAYDDRALGEGDVLGFKVEPGAHRGVVLLSVDGRGQVSVYWPSEGEAPEPLTGPGAVALPGSLTLDGAPGPELFVAVFDRPVSAARAEVERAWQAGGQAGLLDWAARAPEADVAVVNRR